MKNLAKAQADLANKEYLSLLVTDPIDLFYLLGLELSLGTLWISQNQALLFVDGRYQEAAQLVKGIEVRPLTTLDRFLQELKGPCGFDKDHLTYGQFQQLAQHHKELVPLFSPIKTLRAHKEPSEIAKIKIAAELCMRGMKKVMESVQEGISEKELAHQLDFFWKKEGGDRFSFDPIIAFGANSSKPHYRGSSGKLKRGELILIDIGVVVDHYHSDMTRVFGFGEVSAELQKIYTIVHEAKQLAIAKAKEGVLLSDVDGAARNWITEKGYGDQFVHGLGHGIGLQTHEAPYVRKERKEPLQIGNIITIEPGIYLPGLGGVRLEDMVVIKKEGAVVLTPQFDTREIVCL